jgi:hypothetical protein
LTAAAQVQGQIHGNGFWNCGRCGAMVPNNCVHSCPTQFVSPSPLPVRPVRFPRDRVADALERIATALEKLAAREG